MNDPIYSLEIPSLDPLYLRKSNIPYKSAIEFLDSNKNLRNICLFSNGEWVAKSNHKRCNELYDKSYSVVLWLSRVPETFKEFVFTIEKQSITKQ